MLRVKANGAWVAAAAAAAAAAAGKAEALCRPFHVPVVAVAAAKIA